MRARWSAIAKKFSSVVGSAGEVFLESGQVGIIA
jgi:hypothetical protein